MDRAAFSEKFNITDQDLLEADITWEELELIDKVRTIYQAQHKIPCTACRYCVDGCPAGIPIPDIFGFANEKHKKEPNPEGAYTDFEANVSACLDCGKCEAECPQRLHIRKLLQDIHKEFA